MEGNLTVGLLGPVTVQGPGGPLVVAGLRRQAVLALLALAAPRPVSDDGLLEALWGDDQPAKPANALQALVSQLRRLLGSDVVVRDGNGYRLAVEPDAVDVHRLERLLGSGRQALLQGDPVAAALALDEAVGLVRGPPLVDLLDLPFARDAARRLEDLALEARERRIDAELAAGRHAAVVGELAGLVEANPLRERFVAQLALALYRTGRQAEALRVLHDARDVLVEELGIDPGPELAELEQAILAHDPALRPPGGEATASPLPVPVSSFVGRQAELADVADRLATARLISIVGVGGMGKTRLALEAATRAGAVGFVELGSVTEAAAVPEAVAEALGAPDRSAPESPAATRSALDRVVDRLGAAPAVVVLDNCEHVLDAVVPLASTLLRRCAGLRLVATSREALGIAGEEVVALGPMATDDAARLFADRARAVRSSFEATDADVDQVCARLDRLPLAIELAAARTRSLAVPEIVDRLDDLLRTGSGLRAAVDWSYGSLEDRERAVFCRLAVFAGGASAAAAESFCGPGAVDALDRLVDTSLVVADTSGPRVRFRLLETLRAYGCDRLTEADLLEATETEHVAWCVALAEEAAPHCQQRDELVWLDVLDAEQDNFRAALAHAAQRDPASGLRLLGALVLPWYLRGRHQEARHWIELLLAADDGSAPHARANVLAWSGRIAVARGGADAAGAIEADLVQAEARAREAIALLADGPPVDLANAHRMLLLDLVHQYTVGVAVDTDELDVLFPETIARYEALDDDYGLAIVCSLLAVSALVGGDLEAAQASRLRAEQHARRSGNRFSLARVAWLSAVVAEMAGDVAGAYDHVLVGIGLLEELRMEPFVTAQAVLAARLAELNGDVEHAAQWRAFVAERDGGSMSFDDLATTAMAANADGLRLRAVGEVTAARARHRQSREWFAEAGVASGLAMSESCLGFLAAAEGDGEEARTHHEAALAAAVDIEDPGALALALEGLAGLDGVDPTWSTTLLGGAEAQWATSTGHRHAVHDVDVAATTERVQAALGDEAFAAAWATGQAMDRVALTVRAQAASAATSMP